MEQGGWKRTRAQARVRGAVRARGLTLRCLLCHHPHLHWSRVLWDLRRRVAASIIGVGVTYSIPLVGSHNVDISHPTLSTVRTHESRLQMILGGIDLVTLAM